MPLGPGKYDNLCTHVREQAKAAGAIVIVFHGEFGNGFACQLPPVLLPGMPDTLRALADEIEASIPSDTPKNAPQGISGPRRGI